MRKHTKLFVLALCMLTVLLTATGMAQGFEKTQEYPGTFSDVPANAWYAKEVQSAYELGFVNGKSDTSFDPDGTMTVAEGVTIASRVHAAYNGKTIEEVQGAKWYDMYVKYAVENGLFEVGYFNNYDRTIRRYEMAVLFASAVPESYLTAKNDITSIPDVNENEEYADTLLLLYKAGVVLGSDDYGTFLATNPVKRSEAAAIVNRTALPENRLSGTLAPVPEMNEAYYLMDHYSLIYNTRGTARLTSSWNYEDRYSSGVNKTGITTNALTDTTDKGYASINRDFEPQTKGVMTFEGEFSLLTNMNGARIYFTNLKGENVLEIYTKNGVFNVKTQKMDKASEVKPTSANTFRVVTDLDNKKGYYVVNGVKAGEFELGNFGEFARLYFATSVEEKTAMTPTEAHIYMNYAVNESFYFDKYPIDWEKSDKAIIELSANDRYGTHVLKFAENGKATKKFDTLTDKTVFESYFYMPDGADTAYVSLDGALKLKINGDTISADGFTHKFKNNVWQCIHIEADPKTDKAVIFINGKNRGTVAMKADSFSSVSFEYEKKSQNGYIMFDDVKVYNVYDYADYCPVPNKVESKDYTLIMSVCSLWREGTHSGWDFAAPYDECSPLMGYYDEGVPETADWETKFMVEHGIDALQYCWYATNGIRYDTPSKTPGLAWSQHDGYFYSKYSDMIDYCFMWENANFASAKMTLEQFKDYLWDYWVEWYFRDDRYLTVDNKPVFHIYSCDNFFNTFGDDGAKQVIDFMNEDIKKYGYDGMIVLWQSSGGNIDSLKKYNAAGGDGIMTYAYGQPSYDPEYLKDANEKGLSNIKAIRSDFYLVPTVATGRNTMGWENTRTPLSTVEQHREVLEYYKEFVNRQGNHNMIYFSTWNEFGEGHWLAPSGLNGFGYADEWRNAFTKANKVHDDVLPTINQQSRICKLYNDNRSPIRAWLLEDYSVETIPVLEWDFENGATADGWSNIRQSKPVVINGALHNESKEKDPFIRTPVGLKLNAADVTGIRVIMKSNVISSSWIHFTTEKDQSWNQAKGMSTTIPAKDEWVEMFFDTTKNANWTGTIDCIRFDLIEAEGTYDIKKIIVEGKAGAKNDIVVDGVALEMAPYYIENTGDEYYVVADPDSGILSANNFYYEWNRWNGTMYIKTGTETEFFFTVGKDTALVNGKEQKLKKAFYTFDHMPVLPMYFILDNAGIKYTKGDILEVSVRNINVKDIIENRQPYQYEFDIPNDMEGWTFNNLNGVVADGVISATAKPSSSSSTGYDPGIVFQNINLAAKEYVGCEIRMKYEFLPSATGKMDGTTTTAYFATSTSGKLSESQAFRVDLAKSEVDSEGYTIVKIDLTTHEEWKGNVTIFRFDPTNNNGIYTIDYVRFIGGDNVTAEDGNKKDEQAVVLASEGKKIVEEKTAVFSYDFDSPETSNFNTFNATNKIENGILTVVAGEGKNDVMVHFKGVPDALKSATDYDVAVARMKLENHGADAAATIFFQNDSTIRETFSAKAHATTPYSGDTPVDEEGYMYLVLDLGKNEHWTGDITALRFDPADMYDATYYIDYIKFYKLGTGNAKPSTGAPAEEKKEIADGSAATAGVIVNGNAEDGDNAAFFSHNGTLSVVTEENGNKAWQVLTKPGQNWTYIQTDFGFRTGKTYKYSYDVKLVGDSEGETEIAGSVVLNFRYTDSTATDGNGSKYDHNVVLTKLKAEDGWVHVEGEFVAANVEAGSKPHEVAFYSNPTKKGDGHTSFSYMVDNVVVTEV